MHSNILVRLTTDSALEGIHYSFENLEQVESVTPLTNYPLEYLVKRTERSLEMLRN